MLTRADSDARRSGRRNSPRAGGGWALGPDLSSSISARISRPGTRTSRSFLPLLVTCLICLPHDRAAASDDYVFGPLLSRFPLTLEEGGRTEALGPLFYEQQRDTEHPSALPPFFTHVQNPDVDSEEYDFLYPALSYDRFGGEYRWHLGQ